MRGDDVIEVLRTMCSRMQAEKDRLTELDNALADGDHGINMARGFAAVEAKLPQFAGQDLGTVLKTVGMTVLSAAAGSAGLLFGTIFIRSGGVMAGKTEMTADDFLACLAAAVEGVKARGKAERGEKTMLDAMIPAHEAMESAAQAGSSAREVLAAGVKSAWEGVEYTKTIVATKGRASYVGERGLGHQDPGATTFAILLECVAEHVSA